MAHEQNTSPVNGVEGTNRKRLRGNHRCSPEKQFQVNSPGYEETFDTRAEALNQVTIMKKRAIKSKEAIKVTVKEIDNGKVGKTIHKLDIKDQYFQED